MNYILVGRTPVAEPDLEKWARWYQIAHRTLRRTAIKGGTVSTVFLGIDHNFLQKGAPILFETMVFLDGDGVETHRCSTWTEAEEQHARVVEAMRARGL